MSTNEVKNKRGKVIGSKESFRDYNELVKISGLLKNSSDVTYYKSLADRNSVIKKAMAEIKTDLENKAGVMCFVSKSNTKELQTFLEGLQDYMKFEKNESRSTLDACKRILNLNDNRTKKKSNQADFQIRTAMDKIYRGTGYTRLSSRERYAIIEKASKSDIKRTMKSSDAARVAFLLDVAGSNNEKFLQDVLAEYDNKYLYKGIYIGKCRQGICTKAYIKYYENIIFGNKVDSSFLTKYNYRTNIMPALVRLSYYFLEDMGKAMTEETWRQLGCIVTDLQKCGVKVKIPTLGMDKNEQAKAREKERIVIQEVILSVEQTKLLADKMKLLNSGVIGFAEWLASFATFYAIPPVGINLLVYTAMSSASRTGIFNDDVIDAARHGKRVKLTITDSKYCPTSVSRVPKYEIIN